MHPVKILENIDELITSRPTSTILEIYRKAFDEDDNIKLLKLRSLLITQMEDAIESTNKKKHTISAIKEICTGLSFSNLLVKPHEISKYFISGNISSVDLAFQIKDFKQDFEAVEKIQEINDVLKESIETENLEDEQRYILLSIYSDVEEAIFEHKITGNQSIRKLYEVIVGKFGIYREVLENIKSDKIKKCLAALYTKVTAVNKEMNNINGIISKVDTFLEWLY